ncbi:MAG: hypothetical protein AMJ46_13580 [Latescibacteria bacterium DG_63]|nr:MAG: hypothetical protein AMJ46_13580 [Latescibacteria bacterium DG_63]
MNRKFAEGSVLLVALLVSSTLVIVFPASASTGNILIGTATPPSPAVSVRIGDNVSLYFGSVTWSGGLLELYLSTNGYAALSKDDVPYGPVFSVASIKVDATDTTTYPGYNVGRDWINGTIPTALEIPRGVYYVKAFDGSTSTVAVTDNYITIKASFEVSPNYGPGQALIELKGYALPTKGYANLSYQVQGMLEWVKVEDLVQADATGRFVYLMLAPDLGLALPSGERNETYTPITFRMIVNSTGQNEVAAFKEYSRGLKLVEGKTKATATDGTLYGNLTDFYSLTGLCVEVEGSLSVKGKWFHPGPVTVLWDDGTLMGSSTSDKEGSFEVKVKVPVTSKGMHYVVIDDTKVRFVFGVYVAPTLIPVPHEGPVGASVIACGYGFPASDSTIYNVTVWWESIDYCESKDKLVTWALTDADGRFEASFEVPHTYSGPHNVTAVTENAELTNATTLFTVTPSLWVDPSTGHNNGTIMNVHGAGLDPSDTPYLWYLDNTLFAGKDEVLHPDCRGDIHFQFVCAGFCCSGMHTVFAIKGGTQQPQAANYTYGVEAFATFTVVREETTILDEIRDIKADIGDIRQDVVTIEEDTVTIKSGMQTLDGRTATMEGDVISIKTDLGTVKVDIAAAKTATTAAASAASDAKAAAEAARSEAAGVWFLSLVAAISSAATLIITVIVIVRETFAYPAE